MPADSVMRLPGKRDPGALLVKQLQKMTGGKAQVSLTRERPWASITFAGTRHSFSIQWPEGTESRITSQLAETLPGLEFSLPGWFVADIVVTDRTDVAIQIEALSIIDPVAPARI